MNQENVKKKKKNTHFTQSQLHIKPQRNTKKKKKKIYARSNPSRAKLKDNPFQDHRVSQDPGTKDIKNRCNLETRSLSAFENHENREGPKNQAVDFTATFGDYSRKRSK